MLYLLISDENGQYEKDGVRYSLLVCSWVKGQRANDFTEFNSLEEAETAYGLTKVEGQDNGQN